MLTYSFSKIGSESLYMYLYKCIREDILTGKITPGTKLPSKRSFAENLGVSVITVENAYAQLVSEGYVYALPKKGFFAANLEKSTAPQKKESPRTQMPVPPKYFADFSSSRTDPQNFPFATWAKLMREIISEKSAELMVNAPCGGVFELRCAIAEHLREFRGIDADPNCIVVGAGTEYLYGLLIQLLGFDKVYALEDPGYRKIAQVYESYGVQYRFTPMDKEGIDPKALEKSGADILHISPSHHFPTGIVTPIARRYTLLDWAAQSENRYIIEDDYDSEFRFDTRPLPSLQGMAGADGPVVYLSTCSRSLAPSIRIAYMVLPEHLLPAWREKYRLYSGTVSRFEQQTLARFITEGYFTRHLARERMAYKTRRDALAAALDAAFAPGELTLAGLHTGLHLLAKLKDPPPDAALRRAAEAQGIRLGLLSDYDLTGEAPSAGTLVLGYGSLADEACASVGEALKKACTAAREASLRV